MDIEWHRQKSLVASKQVILYDSLKCGSFYPHYMKATSLGQFLKATPIYLLVLRAFLEKKSSQTPKKKKKKSSLVSLYGQKWF